MKALKLEDLENLVGKQIKWTAEAASGNSRYGGISTIISIDLNNRRPIVSSENTEDDISFAFVDDHSLIEIENGFRLADANGQNNCLSYSDSYREILFELENSKPQMKNNETTFWFRHWKQLIAFFLMIIAITIILVTSVSMKYDYEFLRYNCNYALGLLAGYIIFYDFEKDRIKRKALRDNRRKLEEDENE